MKTIAFAWLTALFLAGSALAQDMDGEEWNRILAERDQVASGDYTYQVLWNGTIVPRCDRYANELRRRRDPSQLRFPEICGAETVRARRR